MGRGRNCNRSGEDEDMAKDRVGMIWDVEFNPFSAVDHELSTEGCCHVAATAGSDRHAEVGRTGI